MSLKDVLDRITGRRAGGDREIGRTRSRSQATVQLPASQRPGIETPAQEQQAPDTAPPATNPPATHGTPETGPAAAVSSGSTTGTTSSSGPASEDETQIHRQPVYKKEDVVGVLVAVDGELKGEVYKIFDGENRLGRSESSDIVLTSKWISREHAMLVHQDGVFAVLPRTESNRTYVNEREVDGAELSDGDAIRMGKTTFRFRTIDGL